MSDVGDLIKKKIEKIHPKYDEQIPDNDFMLVFLERPTTANVELVNLNAASSVPSDGKPVTVMGWGDTDKSDDVQTLSWVLKHVEVNVVPNDVCEKSKGISGGSPQSYAGVITKNMLCARDRDQDACQGDSGEYRFCLSIYDYIMSDCYFLLQQIISSFSIFYLVFISSQFKVGLL